MNDEADLPDAPPPPAAHGNPLSSRSIRSFVLRQGRMSPAQQRYLDTWMPRIGVPFDGQPIDFEQLFGRRAPVVVEIGFGMGDTTAEIAAAQPGTDFIGIEVHAPGVGALCKLVAERGINNLRIAHHDAIEVLEQQIAPASLAGVHVFFPDPWRKARHHKRRIIQPPLVALIASRLAPGGYLHCATDWAPYAEAMLPVLEGEALLSNTARGFAPRPEHRPLTKFERRGLRLGHEVFDLVFVRRT